MKKKINYYFMIVIPIMLIITQLEILGVSLGDIVFLLYIFIAIITVLNKGTSLYIKEFFNIYIILFIILVIFMIFRSFQYDFSTIESQIGNELVVTNIGYIRDRIDFTNFFRVSTVKEHLFMYIRFILLFLIMPIGAKICRCRNEFWNYVSKGILFAIVINLLLSVSDIVAGVRINGLLGHAQDISAICILYIAIEFSNVKKVNKVGMLISLIALCFSGTRSAIFSVVVLYISYLFRNKINTPFITVYGALGSSLLISYSNNLAKLVLKIFSLFTDNWDLMIRFELWSKVFLPVAQSNPLWGSNSFPSFADNILWWIYMPLGLLGVVLFFIIFGLDAVKAKRNKNYIQGNLIVILFSQGVLFTGFLGPHFILLWGFLYGAAKIMSYESKKN